MKEEYLDHQSSNEELIPESEDLYETSEAMQLYRSIAKSSIAASAPMHMTKAEKIESKPQKANSTKQFFIPASHQNNELGEGSFGGVRKEEQKVNRDGNKITSIKTNGVKIKYDTDGNEIARRKVEPKYALKQLKTNTPEEELNRETTVFRDVNEGKAAYSKNGDTTLIAMDLAPGKPAQEYIKANANRLKSDPARCIQLCFVLINIVKHCHEKGWIHSDIKMENIHVWEDTDRQIHATLLDFGLARKPDEQAVFSPELYTPPGIVHRKCAKKELDAHVNRDYYALFASLLYTFHINNIKHPFLGKEQNKFNNKFVGHPLNFSADNKAPSNPISQLMCSHPYRLPENHISKIEVQLECMKPHPPENKDPENKESAHSRSRVGFCLMVAAVGIATTLGAVITTVAVVAAAPVVVTTVCASSFITGCVGIVGLLKHQGLLPGCKPTPCTKLLEHSSERPPLIEEMGGIKPILSNS